MYLYQHKYIDVNICMLVCMYGRIFLFTKIKTDQM